MNSIFGRETSLAKGKSFWKREKLEKSRILQREKMDALAGYGSSDDESSKSVSDNEEKKVISEEVC